MQTFNTNDLQTKLFNTTGAFFAFSNKQFEEAQKEGVIYCDMGAGLICPKANAKALADGLESINKQKIAYELENNTIAELINDSLGNYETQLTGDISETVAVMADYGITEQQVKEQYSAYFQLCVENDWF